MKVNQRVKGIEIHQIEEIEQLFYVFMNSTKEDYHIEIKTVHQLQNLYFALTGEELTLKQ